MNVNLIRNVGFILLAILLLLGGGLFLAGTALHLTAYTLLIVHIVLAVLAICAGVFILLGR